MGGDATTKTQGPGREQGTPVYWGNEGAESSSPLYVTPEMVERARRQESKAFMARIQAANGATTPPTSQQDDVNAAIDAANKPPTNTPVGTTAGSTNQPSTVPTVTLPPLEGVTTNQTQPAGAASGSATTQQAQIDPAVAQRLATIDAQNRTAINVLQGLSILKDHDIVNGKDGLKQSRDNAESLMGKITDQSKIDKALEERAKKLTSLQNKREEMLKKHSGSLNNKQETELLSEFFKLENSFLNKLRDLAKDTDNKLSKQFQDQNKELSKILKDVGLQRLGEQFDRDYGAIGQKMSGVQNSRVLEEVLNERKAALERLREEIKSAKKKTGGLTQDEQEGIVKRAQDIQAKLITGFLRSLNRGASHAYPAGSTPTGSSSAGAQTGTEQPTFPALPEAGPEAGAGSATEPNGASKQTSAAKAGQEKHDFPGLPAGDAQSAAAGAQSPTAPSTNATATPNPPASTTARTSVSIITALEEQNRKMEAAMGGVLDVEELKTLNKEIMAVVREQLNLNQPQKIALLNQAQESRNTSLIGALSLKKTLDQGGLTMEEKKQIELAVTAANETFFEALQQIVNENSNALS